MIVDFSLTEKVAVVTGAAVGGIGAAYANALAEAILGTGGSAIAVGVDITDDASVQAMVQRAVNELGGVDILVNNAALMAQLVGGGSALEYPPDLWDLAFAVNVKGSWNCARAVVPH